LHPQTVRKWISRDGLKTIDAGKPALVFGYDLIVYLKKNNSASKRKAAFDEMYCMGCQDARPIFRNKISVEQNAQYLKVQGACRECKRVMFKNYKLTDFLPLRQKFTLVGVLELYDFAVSTDKTHIPAQGRNATSESMQGDLF
jgi:hypothetical protein